MGLTNPGWDTYFKSTVIFQAFVEKIVLLFAIFGENNHNTKSFMAANTNQQINNELILNDTIDNHIHDITKEMVCIIWYTSLTNGRRTVTLWL